MRLSVIIPGYNTPKAWWMRCVDSVLEAIGLDDEVVVVDDGSAEKFSVTGGWWLDERVRVVRKTNGGLSSARNAGMSVARGEFVAFVDSDDEVISGVFGRCLAQIERTASDLCIYGVRTVWVGDGLQKVDACDDKAYGVLNPLDVYDLSKRCLMNYACNKVYRMSFLRNHRIEFDLDGMPCEDIIYNLECVMAGAKWCSVDCVGYVYYRTRGTLLSKYKPTSFVGVRHGAEAWRRFAAQGGEIADEKVKRWLVDQSVLTEDSLVCREWKNIWMPGTPYSLAGRWKWLREHPSVGGWMAYLRMLVYIFLRRHFYWRPVRRWNIRRMYPYVSEWKV